MLRGGRASSQTAEHGAWSESAVTLRGLTGRRRKERPRSEPDRGNLAVRDRRGACGNVAKGVGMRPAAKAVDTPPNPNAYAPQIYPDLPPRERGGFRVGVRAGRRLKVKLPPRERGGFRVGVRAGRRLKVRLPPRERGGFRACRAASCPPTGIAPRHRTCRPPAPAARW